MTDPSFRHVRFGGLSPNKAGGKKDNGLSSIFGAFVYLQELWFGLGLFYFIWEV